MRCVSYVTTPVGVSLPFFLLLLLVRGGHDVGVSLHPGIESQDVLHQQDGKLTVTVTVVIILDSWCAEDRNIEPSLYLAFLVAFFWIAAITWSAGRHFNTSKNIL